MRVLTALVKDQAPALVRAYAGVVAPATSPFLRFSNPYPTPVDTTPLLSTIPETQVRPGSRGGSRQSRAAADLQALWCLVLVLQQARVQQGGLSV